LWRAERPEWYTAVCIVWFCIMGATIVGITVLALANIEVTEPADPVL
jgi:molybdate/tungstate transport system permease protein